MKNLNIKAKIAISIKSLFRFILFLQKEIIYIFRKKILQK